jgi:hypothetical protein
MTMLAIVLLFVADFVFDTPVCKHDMRRTELVEVSSQTRCGLRITPALRVLPKWV